MKRHAVERPNKAEIRPEDQSEKTDSCREDLWKEIQVKRTQKQHKKVWESSVGLYRSPRGRFL